MQLHILQPTECLWNNFVPNNMQHCLPSSSGIHGMQREMNETLWYSFGQCSGKRVAALMFRFNISAINPHMLTCCNINIQAVHRPIQSHCHNGATRPQDSTSGYTQCYRSGSSPESAITTRCVGRPLCVPTAWMRCSRSMPLVTLPNTTCLPSRWGAGACAGQTHASLTGPKSPSAHASSPTSQNWA